MPAGRSILLVIGNAVAVHATASAKGPVPVASWRGLLEEAIAFIESGPRPRSARKWNVERARAGLDSSGVTTVLATAAEVERTLRSYGDDLFADWLDRTLGGLTPPIEREVLDAIGALGLPISTTNYDGLLEYALGRQAITFRDSLHVREFLAGALEKQGVLHLHGHYRRPGSIVLGMPAHDRDEYDLRVRETLRSLFISRDLVFVGTRIDRAEPNLARLLGWVAESPIPPERQHFLLVRDCDAPAVMAQLPMTLRIRVLSYGNDYGDLAPFLRSLRPAALTPLPPAKSIFLAAERPVSLRALRERLQDKFRTTADFDAFCMDQFESVYRAFSGTMSRTERENLLLAQIPASLIEDRLQQYGLADPLELRPRRPATPAQIIAQPGPDLKAAWSALLQLNRDHQYGKLILGAAQPHAPSRLVILHGCIEQNVALFVSRVEEFFRDDVRCEVLTVPMRQRDSRARSAGSWGLHLKCALEAHLGESQGSLATLLAQAAESVPVLISLVGNENPLQVLGDLAADQVEGLKEFLTVLLPRHLPAAPSLARSISVLLPIEYEGPGDSLLGAARGWAESAWHSSERVHTVLPELKTPSWDEVEDYLRTYRPPLLNLSTVLAEAKAFYAERSAHFSITFEHLARRIDQIVLKHS